MNIKQYFTRVLFMFVVLSNGTIFGIESVSIETQKQTFGGNSFCSSCDTVSGLSCPGPGIGCGANKNFNACEDYEHSYCSNYGSSYYICRFSPNPFSGCNPSGGGTPCGNVTGTTCKWIWTPQYGPGTGICDFLMTVTYPAVCADESCI